MSDSDYDNRWLIKTVDEHNLTDGNVVQVADTGYDQIDGNFYAVHVLSDYVISLMTLDYSNVVSDDYPTDAFITNADGSFITEGSVRLAFKTITDLTWLEGKIVSALCDGITNSDLQVSNGTVTLDNWCCDCTIGLPYTSILEPMGLDSGGEMGTADNQTRRIRKAFVRVQDTFGMQYGCNDLTDTVAYHDFLIRDAVGAVSDTTDLQTGVIDCELDMSYMRDPRFVLKQSNPLPMNVLGITYLYENSETQVRQNQQ